LERRREDAADTAATMLQNHLQHQSNKKDSHNGKPTPKSNTGPLQNKTQNPQSPNLKCCLPNSLFIVTRIFFFPILPLNTVSGQKQGFAGDISPRQGFKSTSTPQILYSFPTSW
jgi:hypothetical protein